MFDRLVTQMYRLQQRLSMTRNECTAILTLSFLLFVGIVARHIQQQPRPLPEGIYARTDRLFDEARAALPAASPQAAIAGVDTSGREETHGFGANRAAAAESGSANAAGAAAAAPSPIASGSIRINLNTASAAELERLPHIGPKTAQRIVEDRLQRGPYRDVRELTRVRGIGEKTLQRLLPLIHLGE